MSTEKNLTFENTIENSDIKIVNYVLLMLSSFLTVAKSAPKLIANTIFGTSNNNQSQENSGGLLGNITKEIGDAFLGNTKDEPRSSMQNINSSKYSGSDSDSLGKLMGQIPPSSSRSKQLSGKSRSNTSTNDLREIQARRKREIYSQRSQPNKNMHPANLGMPGK